MDSNPEISPRIFSKSKKAYYPQINANKTLGPRKTRRTQKKLFCF